MKMFVWTLVIPALFGQNARPSFEASSLPNTVDVMPSQVAGPFDPQRTKEWRRAAQVLCDQSRYAEAEQLYAKLLDEREHSLGLNSPDLAMDLSDLGRVNFAQMKYDQSAIYYDRWLQIIETSKAREETSKSRQDLALLEPMDRLQQVYRMLGKYSAAEEFALRAATLIEQNQGLDAPRLVPELLALGDLRILQKRYSDAEMPYLRVAKLIEGASGASTPAMLPALDGLARCYVQLRRTEDAEASLRRALSIRESSFGPSTMEVADSLDRLGQLYFGEKEFPEAAYCYGRSLFIREKVHGPEAADAQAALASVARAYAAQDRGAEAAPLYRELVSTKAIDFATSLNSLAALLAEHDRTPEAEALYKMSIAALDRQVTARNAESALLAETLDQYAALLRKMRKSSEAARIEGRARILHGAADGTKAP